MATNEHLIQLLFLNCKIKNLEVRRFQYRYICTFIKNFRIYETLQDTFKFVKNIFFEETCPISFLSIKKILSGNYNPNCLFDAILLPRKMCICLPVTFKIKKTLFLCTVLFIIVIVKQKWNFFNPTFIPRNVYPDKVTCTKNVMKIHLSYCTVRPCYKPPLMANGYIILDFKNIF